MGMISIKHKHVPFHGRKRKTSPVGTKESLYSSTTIHIVTEKVIKKEYNIENLAKKRRKPCPCAFQLKLWCMWDEEGQKTK